MSNIFSSAAHRIEKSPWVIFVFLLFCYTLFLACNLWLEDFSANLGVAQMIPTHKAISTSSWVMAAFIQIAPIVLGYTYLRDTNKSAYGLFSILFLGLDWFIGIYFRSYDLPTNWKIYAAVEDFVFFTMGSEVLVMLSFGMVTALFKPAIQQLIAMVIGAFVSTQDNQKQQQNKPKQQGQPQYFQQKHGDQRPKNHQFQGGQYPQRPRPQASPVFTDLNPYKGVERSEMPSRTFIQEDDE